MRNRSIVLAAILILSLTSWSAFALRTSDDHDEALDWRTDRQAYESVRRVPPPPVSVLAAGSFERFDIAPGDLRQRVSELSGDAPVRLEGIEVRIQERRSETGKSKARKHLSNLYRDAGFEVSLQTYSFGNNFVAEKKGTDPASKVLILTSHLDSVQCPGADDDGTGTVSAWAIARALANREFTHTLRIVAFDQEEQGLIGSFRYVQSLTAEERARILGVINLEMTAYHSKGDGGFHTIDCDRGDSVFLSESLQSAITALQLPLTRVSACTNRSDHASFWRANIPAIVVAQNFFGGDANPCYHKACDRPDVLNFEYMARLTQAVASTTSHLLVPTR